MVRFRPVLSITALLLVSMVSVTAAQFAFTRARDPGPRGGPAGAGDPLPGLTATQQTFFTVGLEDFSEVEGVGAGLGPRFNLDSSININGNDGTIARFGWKAQNKSMLLFSGEAYNVEMGITNELFQTEREEARECQFATVPNGTNNLDATTPIETLSAIENFSNFMRFLAAPTPSPDTPGGATSIANGRQKFSDIGCALCHTPSFTTSKTTVAALSEKPVNLFSDLLVHDMGDGLADGVSQGEAGPREFRTAPLWGLGQRIFFLHDGRTANLERVIREHSSNGSEANGVVGNYNNLGERTKQDILNFLRSL